MLLLGAVEFGDGKRPASAAARLPALPRFNPLPGTETEVNDLKKRFQKAFPTASAPVLLREGEATKDAFVKAAAKADHLNTASGTPMYLSPEQASGQTDAIGSATDVFGLGAVLYFLLSGRPLYQG